MTAPEHSAGDRGSVVLRSRDGAVFAIPLTELARFELPYGSVVLEWRGRYLVLPADAVAALRLSDEQAAAFVERRGAKEPRTPRGPQART